MLSLRRSCSYHYALGLYQLFEIAVLTHSGPSEKPRGSFSLRSVGLVEIGLPDAFASLGHRVRVRGS